MDLTAYIVVPGMRPGLYPLGGGAYLCRLPRRTSSW
jgi:hypothetical protein